RSEPGRPGGRGPVRRQAARRRAARLTRRAGPHLRRAHGVGRADHDQGPGGRPLAPRPGPDREHVAPVTLTGSPPLVEFAQAAFTYGGGGVAVEADLRVAPGALVGLVGPSGAGKTTLLRAPLGQLGPVRGRVLGGGSAVRRRPTRQAILDLLAELNLDGVGILLTTHDLNAVAALLPELVCLNGRVVAQGRPDQVLRPDVLRATFGSEMVVIEHDGLRLATDAPSH